MTATEIPSVADRLDLSADVIVVGGGTAGTMAALSAAESGASVLLLEKAHVRHSGALAMGMDGVNNAVIPGKATPEEYVAEITRANDGIVNQRTIMQTASRGYEMVQRLERYGVKFEKDEHNEYAVRQVHRSGRYVLPMPEGKDVKKVLYRVLRERRMRDRIRIENRVMPVRVLTRDNRAVGVVGFHTRTGQFVIASAGAVILATGACGRLGLPASGYLYGTYENPTNAGDGHAMALHAGAELSGIECYQINPLIKDYNGPACAYVANPFGGYQVNNRGERFVDCDYWSGQMMAEFAREVSSDRAPVYLKLTHLPDTTISKLEAILHTTERPTRGTFHAGRGHDYRTHDVEMHISEVGLCGGHSASGVWVDENAATTVDGLFAAGDLACVPHNYMIGAFVFGDLAGRNAAELARVDPVADAPPDDQLAAAHELIYRPFRNPDGAPQQQVEYKLRRLVNDYITPPKTSTKLTIALEAFARMEREIAAMGAQTPHELMRCVEVSFIRDCAEMAARASLTRTESRWGLYHDRVDYPERDDDSWFCHLNLRRQDDGTIEFRTRPVAPYLVPVDGFLPPAGDGPRVLTDRAHSSAELSAPTRLGGEEQQARDAAATARLLELVRLAERGPDQASLAPYLTDADPAVRRVAIGVLTETTPEGAAESLVLALDDPAGQVRAAAAAGLRELADVLPRGDRFTATIADRSRSSDPEVRALAIDLLRILGHDEVREFAVALRDPDERVRVQAVRGLVRLGALTELADAVHDPAQAVRSTLAKSVGSLAGAAPLLRSMAQDADVLVRAAALSSAGQLAADGDLARLAAEAIVDPAWQLREGAASALGAADSEAAIPALLAVLGDANLDVRKAAVRSLTRWASVPAVTEALRAAQQHDADADVRAYSRLALEKVS